LSGLEIYLRLPMPLSAPHVQANNLKHPLITIAGRKNTTVNKSPYGDTCSRWKTVELKHCFRRAAMRAPYGEHCLNIECDVWCMGG
jgi:hypothetical protein